MGLAAQGFDRGGGPVDMAKAAGDAPESGVAGMDVGTVRLGANAVRLGVNAVRGLAGLASGGFGAARGGLALALNLALPPRCPACGVVVDGDRQLCLACWQTLDFLDGPACARCSMPLVQHKALAAMECGACLADPPAFEGAPAAVAYGAAARKLALRLKHGRRLGDAQLMAQFMVRHIAKLAGGQDALLVPVPLHRWRLWARGYNQSALMAQHMARLSGAAHDPHVLVRRKSTPVLRGKGRRERRDIVRGAFAISADRQAMLRGRHVILIDDVHASGATLRACAATLKRGGAARVSAITWARVVPAAIMTSNIFDFAAWDSDMGGEEHTR